MDLLVDQFFDGLGLVGPILLVSLSLSTVLASTRVLNVAVGSTVVWSAYAGIKGAQAWGTPGLFLATIASALLICLAIELAFLRWQRTSTGGPEMASFAATLGLGSSMIGAFILVTAGVTYTLPSNVLRFDAVWSFSGINVQEESLVLLVIALVMTAIWGWFVHHRPTGKMYRALAANRQLAESIGMRTKRISLSSWIVCGLFIGIASALVLAQDRSIDSNSGSAYLLVPFAAVVAGGMGSLLGTVVAAIFFGLSEGLLSAVISLPGYRDAIVFIMLFLLLVIRPEGLVPVASGERNY
jgi:branched-subunit amino acid ABC-type transport system permease component